MGHMSEVDVSILAGLDRTPSETDNAAEKFPLFKTAELVEESEYFYISVGW